MDTKFSSSWWSHHQVESASPEIKLAGVWLRTNDRLRAFGYAEVTAERFAFETGLAKETFERAIKALSEWFIRTPKGYFVPRHIGEQIGRGEKLLSNNICKGLLSGIAALHDPSIYALILQHYPELEVGLKVLCSAKPLASPPEGVREGEGEGVREGEGEGVRDRGAGERELANGSTPHGSAKPSMSRARRQKPGARVPGEQPEPMRSRMLSLNGIFRRAPTTAWSADDVRALESSGLLTSDEFDFVEACESVRAFYAAKIPREMEGRYWRRTTLGTLINNWAGELDKARAWTRDTADSLTRV